MTNKELSPMEQAEIELPKTWYEISSYKKHTLLTVGSSFGLLYANANLLHLDSIPVHAAGAAIYIFSTLADRHSTIQAFKANEKAIEAGLGSLGEEANPLMKDVQTGEDFTHSKKPLAFDALATAVSSFFPAFGMGVAIENIHLSASNSRVAKRIRRAVEISRK